MSLWVVVLNDPPDCPGYVAGVAGGQAAAEEEHLPGPFPHVAAR